jgi:hypothetical protein
MTTSSGALVSVDLNRILLTPFYYCLTTIFNAYYLTTYHPISHYRIAYYLFLLPILPYIYRDLLDLALIYKVLILNCSI